MKFISIAIAGMLFSIVASAQTGDMIVIKRKGITVKTFMKGLTASFKMHDGEAVYAEVLNIKNDSLYFREVIVRQVPTPWGVPRLDTMAAINRRIHYLEIASVLTRPKSFPYLRNGTFLMIGGAGYVGLNVINSAVDRTALFSKDNTPRLLGGVGAFALGKAMEKLHKDELRIRKKNTIHYLRLNK